MNIKTMIAAVALSALAFAVPAQATDVHFGAFGAFGGVVLADGSGTFSATFAQGGEFGGGESFGKTEAFANAASNFRVDMGGVQAGFSGNSGSASTSGSLVNGNGAAWNQTGGVGAGFAGVGGVAGGGIGFVGH